MDGGELLFREPDAGVVGFDPPDRRADRRVGEVGRAVAGGRARHFGDALLDPELLGVADPLLAFVQAEDERDRLAVVDEAARLDQAYDRVDVVPSARGSCLDQAARRMNPQALSVEDGFQLEFRRERCGGGGVSRLAPLVGRTLNWRRRAKNGRWRPSELRDLLAPDRVRFLLGLAEPPRGARLMQHLFLALERELVPVDRVFAGVALCVADHLPVAFREGRNGALGDVEGDGRLAAGVEADPQPKRAQAVGEAGLKEGSVFRDLVGGQRLRVDRADPAIVGDDEVRNEIMQMVMRIAGDRRVEKVGRAVRPVLDGDGRPRRVMGERHPADLACLRALFSRMPFPGEAEVVSGVAERVVARGVNGVADHLPLGLGGRELGRQRYGFVRGEDEVESRVFPDMLAPVLAGVGAARFEQGVELAVAGSGAGACDAERRRDAWVHVGPPVRPLASACVVGGEALPGFEVATIEGDAMDLERLRFRLVLGHVGADRRAVARGGDFPEIEHGESGVAGAVGGSVGVGCGGSGRREPRQGVVDLAQQGGHAGLLGQDAGEKVGERWSFLFGPLRGQDLDHMGDLASQGFELALEGLAVFKKSVLGVIHFFEEFADADEVVGDSAEVRVIGVVAEGHEDDPWVGQGWSGVAGKEASEAGAALRPLQLSHSSCSPSAGPCPTATALGR